MHAKLNHLQQKWRNNHHRCTSSVRKRELPYPHFISIYCPKVTRVDFLESISQLEFLRLLLILCLISFQQEPLRLSLILLIIFPMGNVFSGCFSQMHKGKIKLLLFLFPLICYCTKPTQVLVLHFASNVGPSLSNFHFGSENFCIMHLDFHFSQCDSYAFSEFCRVMHKREQEIKFRARSL